MSDFFRALSPAIQSFAGSSSATTASDKRLSGAFHLLASAANVNEVLATLPDTYRDVLTGPLQGVRATANRLCSARKSLASLEAHKASGTIPPSIPKTSLDLQLTAEFKTSADGLTVTKAVSDLSAEFRQNLFAQQILAKSTEIKVLESKITPDKLLRELSPIITSNYASLKERMKRAVFEDVQISNDRGQPSGQTELRFVRWEESPELEPQYRDLLSNCVQYAFRIIQLVEAMFAKQEGKRKEKRELKAAADVEMADLTQPGPSLQSTIDKAVAAQVRAALKGKKRDSSSTSTVRFDSMNTDFSAHRFFKEENIGTSREEKRSQIVRRSSSRSDSLRLPQSAASASRQKVHQKGNARWKDRGEKIGSDEQGIFIEQGQRKEVVSLSSTPHFDWSKYDSYPDELLTMPYPDAIRTILLQVPSDILDAAAYRSSVHIGPGVFLPLEYQMDLSVGQNYMFHSPRNSRLLIEAWKDFEYRIKWRIFFTFKDGRQDADNYDPDYEVPRERTSKVPQLPQYIEYGLNIGQVYITKMMALMPKDQEGSAFKSLAPDPKRIRQYLIDNDYVVTNTDKNLGIAVSQRTWIEEKSLALLNNPSDYERLTPAECKRILDKQCTQMELLCTLVDEAEPALEKQLKRFFRHKVTSPSGSHHIPTFYCIPKIHKEPVKGRPIIPCHSAIQNPAAKYVSKKLKPLIEAAPSIIHGSKDLAIKLSKFKRDPRRRLFIVTGDVVAFYPNIPLQRCFDVVDELFCEFYHIEVDDLGVPISDEWKHKVLLLERAMMYGCSDLVTQFFDSTIKDFIYFKQKRGLAMGVACSPDLANLFGFWFESRKQIWKRPEFGFYGRYIDDCLALVYAHSADEALALCENNINFDGCTIEWNVSEHFQHFLDMTLYLDEKGDLQHMPFRKAMSHQERIPWISHHPLDVKRGSFIGEMSRLATLSSTQSHYLVAIKDLASLYVKRGYPSKAVYHWLNNNKKERWDNRLSLNNQHDGLSATEDVLVLKSTFNSAWDYFSASELGKRITRYWKEWLIHAEKGDYSSKYPKYRFGEDSLKDTVGSLRSVIDSGAPAGVLTAPVTVPDIRLTGLADARWLVSRKRTRNLFDLANLWKKEVFQRMDVDTATNIAQGIPSDNYLDDVEMEDIQTKGDRPVPGDLEYIHYGHAMES
ncbi:hypothetical protein HHX47_DHR3000031 [Lentinula edodes]|nr:hypothetical protein HHX47_DHR3000031 [Lentinula edodes]